VNKPRAHWPNFFGRRTKPSTITSEIGAFSTALESPVIPGALFAVRNAIAMWSLPDGNSASDS